MGTEFPFGNKKSSKNECALRLLKYALKMVKMVNLILCIFYHNKNFKKN